VRRAVLEVGRAGVGRAGVARTGLTRARLARTRQRVRALHEALAHALRQLPSRLPRQRERPVVARARLRSAGHLQSAHPKLTTYH